MAIFGNVKKVTESDTELKFGNETFDDVFGDEDSLMKISQEAAHSLYQINAGMYISDILMEQQVMEGANPEVLLESFGKDMIKKIKETFVKLVQKLKDFFMKLYKTLEPMFLSGSSFVKKYEKELSDKKVMGYSYETFKYTYSAGEQRVAGISDKVTGYTTKYFGGLGNIDDLVDSEKQKENLKDLNGKVGEVSEEKKSMIESVGAKSVEELISSVYKSFRDGKDMKSDFKDFNGNSKSDMMKFILEKQNLLTSIKKDEDMLIKYYSRVIKALDMAGNKMKGQEGYAAVATFVSKVSGLLRYAGSIILTVSRVRITVIREINGEFSRILKGYLRFSPAKESTEEVLEDNEEEASILEAAMKYL